ncbi:MAG: diaminopimelate epimerase [Holophagaceae bacterium]|nr:diaminopimelate epimerase [Holophagaceae bacterium]
MGKARFTFSKYHALGNDYIVIDPAVWPFDPEPERIRLLCDRHRGIGGDGILLGPLPTKDGSFGLRIFNPDGSEAQISGNGLRIFARFLLDAGYANGSRCRIHIAQREAEAEYLAPDGSLIEVDMGFPDFRAEAVPFIGIPSPEEVVLIPVDLPKRTLRVTALSLGNPHAVVFVPRLSSALAKRLGPLLERHGTFPKRTNVQFVKVVDRAMIRIEIWERGAGYTLASGSSASAAAAASRKLGLVDEGVKVEMPGGCVDIAFAQDGRISLRGAVQRVFSGHLDEGWNS